jgi:serine/threonine protein kinase
VEPHRYQTLVAVKVIKYTGLASNENLISRNLSCHDPIVAYLDYYEKQPGAGKTSILLAGCPEGDLFNVRSLAVKRNKHFFSGGFIWSVFSQLVGALAFLDESIDAQSPMGRAHWRPIAHRDIKIENILIKSLGAKEDWSDIDIKLSGFGMFGYHDAAAL